MAVSAEYRRRYLDACDREQEIAERCGGVHLSNVKRIMAELDVYHTGAGWLYLGPNEDDDPETAHPGTWEQS